MTRYSQKDVMQAAEEHGIIVRTWSPGDGQTRYRFFARHEVEQYAAEGHSPQTYFGPASGIKTVLGARAAMDVIEVLVAC